MNSEWENVSSQSPCPLCGKDDWCSITADRTAVNCRRKTKTPVDLKWKFVAVKHDDNNDAYYVWKPESGKEIHSVQPVAEPHILDAVYSVLLKHLPVPMAPWMNLQTRGLRRSDIGFRGYGYANAANIKAAVQAVLDAGLEEHLAKVPGFYHESGQWKLSTAKGLLIPVRNFAGQIVAIMIRRDKAAKGGKYIYLSSKKSSGPSPGSPIHVPRHHTGYDLSPLRITEGPLKADIASYLTRQLTIGLPGVNGFHKAKDVVDEIRPKSIIIALDADYRSNEQVAKALVRAVRTFETNYRVYVEVWPSEDGKGIDDLLASGKKPKKLRGQKLDRLLRQLEKKFGPVEDTFDRPTIHISTREHEVNDQAVAALASDPTIFKRGGQLVHVLPDDETPKGIHRPKGSPRIAILPRPVLQERLARSANWLTPASGDKPEAKAHPPRWTVEAISSRGVWPPIRPLTGIVTGPILRADGTVLATPGYDKKSGLICDLSGGIDTIPDKPTKKQIKQAIKDLEEVVVDFPFESDVHRAVWFAFLLTIPARFAFEGPSPMFLIDANTQASGKGLLGDATSTITTGRKMPRMANPHDDDEVRKRITALAVAGDPLILIDNVVGTLGSPALDAAITSDIWRDRVLGRTETVELPLTPVWCATGNNPLLSRDMTRRVAHIRLNSPLENPEERSGFRHENLLAWINQEQGRLAAAVMTLLRGYWQAGRPDQKLKSWGSFEGWSDLVRSTVVWAGFVDPGEARQELANSADTERQALGALMAGLRFFDADNAGLTASEILNLVNSPETSKKEGAEMLREAIGELCPSKGGAPTTQSLGKKLRYLVGRIIGGRALEKRERNKTSAWFVRNVQTGGTGGTGGIPPSPCKSPSSANTDYTSTGTQKDHKCAVGSDTSLTSPISLDDDDVEVF